MHVQAGDKVSFAFAFVDSDGNGATPDPVPTIDVERIDIDAGTSSEVVTDGVMTASNQTGVYFYIYTTPSSGNYEFVAVATTTDSDVASQQLFARAHSGQPYIEYVDASIATVDGVADSILVDTGTDIPALIAALNDLAASDVWTYASRTITQSGAQVADAVSGSDVTIQTYRKATIPLTSVSWTAGALERYFTVKWSDSQADSDAIIRVSENDGLEVLNGSATVTASDASLTCDVDAGTADIVLKTALCAALEPGTYTYDLHEIDADGEALPAVSSGTFTVERVVGRATS